jgi:hypothetical protein
LSSLSIFSGFCFFSLAPSGESGTGGLRSFISQALLSLSSFRSSSGIVPLPISRSG